jgi:hypothetical protein
MPGKLIAIVRILIGVLFVFLGVRILLDQDLLYGGLMHHLNVTGGPVRFYSRFFLRAVEARETLVVYCAAGANIFVGVLFITGTLFSLSSLAAAFLVLNYGLASSASNYLRLFEFVLASALLIGLGCMGAGLTWGVDGLLIRSIKDQIVLFPLRRRAPGTPSGPPGVRKERQRVIR